VTCAYILVVLKLTWFGRWRSDLSFTLLSVYNSHFLNLKYIIYIFLDIAPENSDLLMQFNLFKKFSVKLQTTHNYTHAQPARICCHNTDFVHVNGHDRNILVIFSQALYKAHWWWILCIPKHVGALLNIL